MNYSITQNGKALDPSKYTIDEKTKTFSINEDNLILDFSNLNNWTFKTGSGCTFKTGPSCTFKTGSGCAFKTGPSCVVIRRDVFEVIELKEDQPIKLNKYNIKGYTAIKSHVVTIDGKDIELSEESFNNLKKQLCD